MMEITVHSEPYLVAPTEETKKGPYIFSNLDQTVGSLIQTFYCFRAKDKGNEEAAEIIKTALAKVLVDFYLLAGKLTLAPDRRLAVDCTGEGAVFVEADSDCDLEALGDVTKPEPPTTLQKLIYRVPGAENVLEMPLMTAQVTRFKCGGFTLGVAVNHCIVDGASMVEFLRSWGETARGIPLSVKPFLDRSLLSPRNPLQIEFPHDSYKPIEGPFNEQEMVYRFFSFDLEKLQKLKMEALADESIAGCSTFEALSGFVWKARTKALGMELGQEIKLLIAVDGRTKLEPPLPKGYFGNGVVLAHSICPAGELIEKPLSFAVGLVQKAKRMIDDRYIRSFIDFFEATGRQTPLKHTLLISTWSKLAFHSIDFGWGEPLRYGQLPLPWKELALFFSEMKDSKAITVQICLPVSAMESFQDLVEL